EHSAALVPESTVLLVTDGAVESRGESVDRGLERLRALIDDGRALDTTCDAIARGDARQGPSRDDVAVLAARVAALEERLVTTWQADRSVLGAMRPLLRRWLRKWDASPDDVYDITVAVQEASANAIEHAYAPGRATFDVEARHADGAITVTVRDHG